MQIHAEFITIYYILVFIIIDDDNIIIFCFNITQPVLYAHLEFYYIKIWT